MVLGIGACDAVRLDAIRDARGTSGPSAAGNGAGIESFAGAVVIALFVSVLARTIMW